MSARFRVLLLVTAVTACSNDIVSSPPPPPPPPTSVSVAYCAGGGLEPMWVAFQDGDGAWTHVPPTANGSTTTFRYEFSSDRGAMAMVRRFGPMTVLSVLYGTPAELETAGDTNPRHCFPAAAKTLLGTAIGIDTTEVAFVGASFGSRARVGVDHTFELNALPDGPRDLLAARFDHAGGDGAITRMILRRAIDVPDSTLLPAFDFGSAEAFAPAVADVSVTGLNGEAAASGTRLLTSHDEISVTLGTSQTPTVTRPYFALPEAQLQPGDLQIVSANTSAGVTGSSRTATLYFRAPVARTLTLGALLIRPTVTTVATAPALRLRAHFVAQPDYDRATVVSYQQDSTRFVAITMTAAFGAISGNGYDLVIPDLSGAAGFDPAWALRAGGGGTLFWNASRIGGTLGLGGNAVPADGTTQRTVFGTGTL